LIYRSGPKRDKQAGQYGNGRASLGACLPGGAESI
jgi:hypothetical protein